MLIRDASNPPNLRELRKLARERFLAGRKAETQYSRSLKQIAKQIDVIVRGFAPDGIVEDVPRLIDTLNRYSDLIEPWAETVATRMIGDVSRRDADAWHQHGKAIGMELRRQIEEAPIGVALRRSLSEQIELIKSLPLEAAQRVHELTVAGVANGTRPAEIASAILQSGQVSKSRAMLIARTEVARTASALTLERAVAIGCTHYHWYTAHDARVRKSHREMDGKVVPLNDPPLLSDGTRTHAGMIYNCRCWMAPILGD